MKLGRFIVDTHVHAQRFAAGVQLSKMTPRADGSGYSDLAQAIRRIDAFDNSPRLMFDMDCYDVDMCVVLPAFGMNNDINIERLGAALRRTIRISASVAVLAPGSLPRPDGRRKMRRVVDLRKG